MFNLKVKTVKRPSIAFKGKVNGQSTLKDLKLALSEATSIPFNKQKILIGFPPSPITGSDSDMLKTLGLQNGEVIIVEEVQCATENVCDMIKEPSNVEHQENFSSEFPRGNLMKKVVPSDNSCLFTSIYFLVNGGEVDPERLYSMRQIVASEISKVPHIYNEALLEKTNSDYCKWLLKETSWGGAIELSVFSDYYQIEIVALDSKSGLVNRFGEDKRYIQRIFLLYDGIHYDPLYLETYDGRQLHMFPSSEEWLMSQAQELVQEAKKAGQFTDTNAFLLVCNDCGIHMHGEKEAVDHAKLSSHTNFKEVKNT